LGKWSLNAAIVAAGAVACRDVYACGEPGRRDGDDADPE
jgi:hypothetical protein